LPEAQDSLGTLGMSHDMEERKVTVDPKVLPEEVLREFPPLGRRYRVRILQNPRNPREKFLDIREYVRGGFEGFTRRGIRISNRAELDLLRDILTEVLRDLLM